MCYEPVEKQIEANMNDELTQKIKSAIESSPLKWRTIRGLAKDLQTSELDIGLVLNYSSEFLRARQTNKNGEALYTTREKYKKQTSLLERALGAAANTVNS